MFKNLWILSVSLTLSFVHAQHGKNEEVPLDSLFLLMNTNPDLTIKLGSELYEKYKGNPQMEISILTIIGSSYSIKKDYEKAIEYALKTREISQKINDYPTQIQVAGFIGEKYHNLKVNSKAKYYFDEAYSLIEKHPLPDSLMFYKGNLLFLKALIYKDELGCDFAMPYYDRALEVYLPLLKDRYILKFSISDLYNEKGYCFLESKHLDSAEFAFQKALGYATNGDFSLLNTESYAGLGRIKFLKKDYKGAQEAFDKVIKNINSKKFENVNPLIYKYISDNYYAQNDIDNYTKYLNFFKQKTNREFSAKKHSVNEIIDKSTSREDQRDTQKKTYWIIIGVLIFILLILVLVIVYGIFVTKRKIQDYKRKISDLHGDF